MWRRTVVDDFWSRSHLTWWACANFSWALLHWNVVASQACSITIMTVSFFGTRQWIWSLTIEPTHHSAEWNPISQSDGGGWWECDKWRGRGSLRQWWRRESWGSRSFSWWPTSNRRCGSSWTAWHFWWNENSKNITYSWTAHRRCEDGTQRNTRSIQRLVPTLCCESRTKFSAQTSCSEQDGGHSAKIPDGLHVHSNSGREQHSAMYYIRGNAQWRSGQLHVRSERWLWGLDEGNPATFWSLRFPRSSHPSMRQRDEHHWRLQKSCTRTKRENSVKICAKNKSSEQRVLSKQCTDTFRDSHDATRHTSRRTLAYSFQQFYLPFHLRFVTLDLCCQDSQCDPTAERHSNICSKLRMCITFVHVWWIGIRVDPRSVKCGAAKLTNRWISGCWWGRDASSDEHLVGTKHGLLMCRSVRRKPPGEQWSRRETIEARGTKWNFDVEMDSGLSGPTLASRPDEGMPTATAQEEIPTVPPPDSHVPEIRGQGVHAPGMRDSWSGEVTHSRMHNAWDESLRTASAEEAKRGVVADPDTRPLDRSGSSMDPEPKRTKNDLCDRQREPGRPVGRGQTSEGDQRPLTNWNQSTMETCRRSGPKCSLN